MGTLIVADWLRTVAASPHADRLVLRGSVLTRKWFPARVAEDVDHLVLGECDVKSAKKIAKDLGPVASQTVIWAETKFPGVRSILTNGLQVDLGWGDPVTTERIEIDGISLVAATPESMVAWKLHGLVELGPRGRWRPKDLRDLGLYATMKLDRDKITEAIRKAFASRGDSVSLLDPFLDDPAWGASSGSRKKWRRYIGTPDLADTIARVRSAFKKSIRP